MDLVPFGRPLHEACQKAVTEQVPVHIEAHDAAWDRWFENRIYPSENGLSIFFHDVTGAGHIAKNNGLYPTVRGYDEATGIGTIKMAPFIIGSF